MKLLPLKCLQVPLLFRVVVAQHMCMRIVILSCAFAIAIPLLAREKTDIIVMNNGDRLTGEIKGLDSGSLSVSFDYILGAASLDWSKVDHLESKQRFLVKTQDGSVYTGTLRTVGSAAKRPIQIEIFKDADHTVAINQSNIIRMTETSATVWQRFNGQITSGILTPKGIRRHNTISVPRLNIPANDGWPAVVTTHRWRPALVRRFLLETLSIFMSRDCFVGTTGFTRESRTFFKAPNKESIFGQILGAALDGI